jgi:hypothetical protein
MRQSQDKVALVVHRDLLGSVERQYDLRGIGAWCHDEVILKLTLIAVIN